jgi:hypothetical protein
MTHAYVMMNGGTDRHTKRFYRELLKRGGTRKSYDVKPRKAFLYRCPTCGNRTEYMKRLTKQRLSCSLCDKDYNPLHRLEYVGVVEKTVNRPLDTSI